MGTVSTAKREHNFTMVCCVNVLGHFSPPTKPSKEKRVLLMLDGYASHTGDAVYQWQKTVI